MSIIQNVVKNNNLPALICQVIVTSEAFKGQTAYTVLINELYYSLQPTSATV